MLFAIELNNFYNLKDILPSMDSLIKLLDVVIWPGIVLAIIFMLRKPIRSLLPFVENIKYKDFEVKFRKELDQIKEDAKDSGIELKTEIDEREEIYKLVDISPASTILEDGKNWKFPQGKKLRNLPQKKQILKIFFTGPYPILNIQEHCPHQLREHCVNCNH